MSANTKYGKDALLYNINGYLNSGFGKNSLKKNTNGYWNTASGAYSEQNNQNGISNVAFGANSLTNNETGNYNTAIGPATLFINKESYNTALGSNSLQYNETGVDNIGIGVQTLFNSTISSNNICIGKFSGLNNNGNNNIGIGKESLYNNNGNENIAIGNKVLYNNNNNGNYNLGLGYETLYNNVSGSNNSAIGFQCLYNNVSGSNNSAIGFQCLYNNVSGSNNSSIGNETLYSVSNANNITAIGNKVLYNNIGGTGNIGIGFQSLYNNKFGSNNFAIGYQASYSGITSSNNLALGYQVLYNNIGITGTNVAFGYQSCYSQTTGYNNVGIGYKTLYTNTSGTDNIAIGDLTLYNNNGNRNIGMGPYALYNNQNGNDNIAIGISALKNTNSYSKNISIGEISGQNSLSSNSNILLGRAIFERTPNFANIIALGPQIGLDSREIFNSVLIGSNTMREANDLNRATFAFPENNVAIGGESCCASSETKYSVFIGSQSGGNFYYGVYGYYPYGNTGIHNIGLGYKSGNGLNNNNYRISIGSFSGYNIGTTLSYNSLSNGAISVGYNCGGYTAGYTSGSSGETGQGYYSINFGTNLNAGVKNQAPNSIILDGLGNTGWTNTTYQGTTGLFVRPIRTDNVSSGNFLYHNNNILYYNSSTNEVYTSNLVQGNTYNFTNVFGNTLTNNYLLTNNSISCLGYTGTYDRKLFVGSSGNIKYIPSWTGAQVTASSNAASVQTFNFDTTNYNVHKISFVGYFTNNTSTNTGLNIYPTASGNFPTPSFLMDSNIIEYTNSWNRIDNAVNVYSYFTLMTNINTNNNINFSGSITYYSPYITTLRISPAFQVDTNYYKSSSPNIYTRSTGTTRISQNNNNNINGIRFNFINVTNDAILNFKYFIESY